MNTMAYTILWTKKGFQTPKYGIHQQISETLFVARSKLKSAFFMQPASQPSLFLACDQTEVE
eukprot:NODE_2656_length_488_cov_147.564920_g2114_i0.p1 GENE.NODE_2656_length_488_cov_147.564920_g2114_i0~~NODE_2656_length_488_cov_147.564920_g2114_i0.p1  ORF type:complete len:62 (-),score=6.36 NODE_2656_length_488_cov_147.564920_g2114_i0:118-303(-)